MRVILIWSSETLVGGKSALRLPPITFCLRLSWSTHDSKEHNITILWTGTLQFCQNSTIDHCGSDTSLSHWYWSEICRWYFTDFEAGMWTAIVRDLIFCGWWLKFPLYRSLRHDGQHYCSIVSLFHFHPAPGIQWLCIESVLIISALRGLASRI